MKINIKSLYTIGIISLLLGMSSCDNFLDRSPISDLSDDNYWESVNDLKLYSNNLYARTLPSASIWSTMDAEVSSDNIVKNTPDAYSWNETIVPTTGGNWDWGTVRDCNYFLTHYQKVEGNKEDIDQYVAEVRFFRAYDYFGKVKYFGDVPWINKDLNTDSEELYAARDSRELVMDSIIADLDFAIKHLPEQSVEKGRLTQYCALTLKSRVALFEGTWAKYHENNSTRSTKLLKLCVEASEKVIDSGKFQIYNTGDVENDYSNLFISSDLNGNPEMILYREYMVGEQSHNLTREIGDGNGYGYSKDLVDSYLCSDGKPIALSPLYHGDDSIRVEFKDRDSRLRQTIWNPDRIWQLTVGGDTIYRDHLPYINVNNPTGYSDIKYHSIEEADLNANQDDTDFPIFRYAEVLLNEAEAKCELGECDQSILDKTINLLRDRAGVAHLSSSVGFSDPRAKFTSITPLLNEIRRERRVELAIEGFRFDDILRWNAGDVLNSMHTIYGMRVIDDIKNEYEDHLSSVTFTPEGYIDVYTDREGRVWNDKLYLHPIPLNDLTLNPNLIQNPGWE